jgi:hypothetical protein
MAALAEGYSQQTFITHQSASCTLMEYLGEKEIQVVTSDDFPGFMSFLVTDYIPKKPNNPNDTDRLSPASHHRYWKAMRPFF